MMIFNPHAGHWQQVLTKDQCMPNPIPFTASVAKPVKIMQAERVKAAGRASVSRLAAPKPMPEKKEARRGSSNAPTRVGRFNRL